MSRSMRMGLACILAIGMVPIMGKAEDPGGGDLKLKATAEDVAELGRIDPAAQAALQAERDKLADDLVRLGNYLHAEGFVLEVDGFPANLVDIAIHHLQLKKGYQESVEASAQILVNAQDQVAALTQQNADLQLALETAQARAKREVEEASAAEAAKVSDATPIERLDLAVGVIEDVANTDYRSGGDAVIELHNATGRLKAAVRQVALIEAATSPAAA